MQQAPLRRVRSAALACALASSLVVASCADDESSPFDPAADQVPPTLVDFHVTTTNQRVFASWQASEPVHAVVELEGSVDGVPRHAYSGERGFADAGVTKLLHLDSNATYEHVRVRLRDRAGNEAIVEPATDASFTTTVLASEELFLFVMIDVGWGDALYFQAPDGTKTLIDAGHPADGPVVRDFLENFVGAHELDFVSLSHLHEDHIGGFYGDDFEAINGLFQNNGGTGLPIPVGTFIDFADKTPGTLNGPYADLGSALEGLGLNLGQHVYLQTGASSATEPALRWGNGVQVDLLAEGRKDFLFPEFVLQSNAGSVQNNDSMIYRVQYGDFVMIVMGDGEFATEQFLEGHYPLDFLHADVLKLGHHGSNDANSERWLNVVDPTVAMITNAVSENPGVEHPFVLGRLRKRGTDYFASDRTIPNRDRAESGVRGDVLLYTDGNAFTVEIANQRYE